MAISLILLAILLGGALYNQREWFLVKIGGALVSEDALVSADAIAVLSGNTPYRVLEAIDLHRKGFAPLILLTQSIGEKDYQILMKSLGVNHKTRFEVNRKVSIYKGIPTEQIVPLPEIDSTKSEAEVILAFLKREGLQSIIVVTSGYHSTRTRLIFRSLNNQDARVIIRPSRYDPFAKKSWWRNRAQSKQVFYEYIKLINHYLIGL